MDKGGNFHIAPKQPVKLKSISIISQIVLCHINIENN